jgi:predicted molibdopterin-dependent oxidoreductase YjgC
MEDNVTIFIDGRKICASKNDTILEAAIKNGIEIPNLCYNKKTSHTAACRLCVVNIEGRPGSVPSCTTPVAEGMKITAFSKELEAVRKLILDLALSNHKDDCIDCTQDGACEFQDLAFKYNLGRENRRFEPIYDDLKQFSDFSSQVLNYDAEKCIQCQRCLKACREVQGKEILTFANRGIKTAVTTGYNSWKESKCDGCGECVQACPVGAITMKSVYNDGMRVRLKDIEKTVQTTCPYCGVGCQINVSTIKDRIVKVEGADTIPNNGSTCVKGRFGLDFVNHPERLKKPLIRKEGKLVEVDWNEAFTYASEKLKSVKEKYGSDSIAGLSSARCTNEENYIFQKFIRGVIGTNNIDHCARL